MCIQTWCAVLDNASELGKLKRMRLALVAGIIVLMFLTGTDVLSVQAPVPSLPTPVDGLPASTDLAERLLRQGGLLSALLVLFYFYRRDFLAKNEKDVGEKQAAIEVLKEERRMLSALVERSTEALTKQALAIQDNTNVTRQLSGSVQTAADVTRMLAANVDKLADRRWLPRDEHQ